VAGSAPAEQLSPSQSCIEPFSPSMVPSGINIS